MSKSKKHNVITDLFNDCLKREVFEFTNKEVKIFSGNHEFGNQFDATKFDHSDKLPQVLKDYDYFILHLGGGRHQFVKGIEYGYHAFEPIESLVEFPYQPSLLNETDSSESNVLSIIVNQGILAHFLADTSKAKLNIYNARRSKISPKYYVGEMQIVADKVQIEIDLTSEQNGIVTIFEAKNGFPNNFAVYQLFHPCRYYLKLKEERNLDIRNINSCYVLRYGKKISMYNYNFTDANRLDSIQLLKSEEYRLVRKSIDE